MSESSAVARYVDAALELQGLELDASQRRRVIETFTATAALAAPLLAYELPDDVDPATVFRA